jgi:hypothetical protein
MIHTHTHSQHGAVECEGNALLNCVQAHYADKHDEFVYCLDWNLIFGCAGGEGYTSVYPYPSVYLGVRNVCM